MKYSIIYADPPYTYRNWAMQDITKKGEKWGKGHGRPIYNLMKDIDIYNIPVQDICEKNCVLLLWCPYPKLDIGFNIIHNWGFIFKTVAFTWVKLNKKSNTYFMGCGYYFRANSEICLLATKGNTLKRKKRNISNLIVSKIEGHSKKPDIARDKIIDLFGDIPRIELFARQQTEGWDATGLDLDGRDVYDAIKYFKNK